VTTGEDVSHPTRVFYANYLWDRPNAHGGYSTTEDDCLHTSGNKSESGRGSLDMLPPTRTLDAVLELLTQIVIRDLQMHFFQSQTYNIMLTHPCTDDRLQLQIISRVLRHFHRQPKVNDRQVLLNLYRLFSNLEKLIAENERVTLKVINLINLIAFKSTTDVRKFMKENKLLELRDLLMVQ
jgi:hypothetical protein